MTVITAPDADETRVDGFYLIGEERFRSVTAALELWDKGGLKHWTAMLAANAAMDELPKLAASLAVPECGRTWARRCDTHDWPERCPECRCDQCGPCVVRWMRERHMSESNRRKDEGTRVHHLVKHWVLTGIWLTPEPDIKAYVDSFKAMVAEYGLVPTDWELAEARVVNRAYGYAGTLDAALWIHRDRSKAAFDLLDRLTPDDAPRLQKALLIVDYKTREKEDRELFSDMPLQLGAYRYAEVLVLADGTEIPMLAVDAAAIIQVRPDRTAIELILAEEPEFAAFLNVLGGDQWAQERGKRAIAARTFSYPPSVVRMRARDQRLAKKPMAESVAEQSLKLPEGTDAANPPYPTATAQASDVKPTPAERGARAAAAAKRPDAGEVWKGIAIQHESSASAVRGKRVPSGTPRGRTSMTLEARVLGAPAASQDDLPPF